MSLGKPLAVAAAIALAATLTACSSNDDPADQPTTPATTAEATAEPTEEAPEETGPEHGSLIAADTDLPENLVAVELSDGTMVAVDGTQPFPETVVTHIQNLIPAPPQTVDHTDPDSMDFTAHDALRAQLVSIGEATGRYGATVINSGDHDEDGNLRGDLWMPQLHSALTDLAYENQQAGRTTLTSSQTPEEAIELLESLINDDPSVWEVIPPIP